LNNAWLEDESNNNKEKHSIFLKLSISFELFLCNFQVSQIKEQYYDPHNIRPDQTDNKINEINVIAVSTH